MALFGHQPAYKNLRGNTASGPSEVDELDNEDAWLPCC